MRNLGARDVGWIQPAKVANHWKQSNETRGFKGGKELFAQLRG